MIIRAISPPWLSGHIGARLPHDRRGLGNLAPHELLSGAARQRASYVGPFTQMSPAAPIREQWRVWAVNERA